MTRKSDADGIAAFMRGLPTALSLRGYQTSWPLHLFRVDDVRSAASILETGALYPRTRAEQLGLLTHDSASPGVIGHTPEWCKECVRLYFRPRTPTEYRSEGFRPTAQIEMNAHRPMPIVFVFEAIPILTDSGTSFTEGNASTSGCKRGSELKFLSRIPFKKVYHDIWIGSEERDVIFHRCAEVLVQRELSFDHLKHLFCRTQAEYETLYSLLSPPTRNRFRGRLGISATLHFRKWTFVESVELSHERVQFRFSPSTITPGPFQAELLIKSLSDQLLGTWSSDSFIANDALIVNLHAPLTEYIVELSLDNELAYRNTFTSEEVLL